MLFGAQIPSRPLRFYTAKLSISSFSSKHHERPQINRASPSKSPQAAASRLRDSGFCVKGCVEASICDVCVFDGELVILGLSGDVSVDARAAEDVVLRGICLRKTRAGGNWLQGGIVKVGLLVC